MKNHKLTTLLIISFLVLPFLVYPDSEEFMVNEYLEYVMQYKPDTAMSPEGDFIITWLSGVDGGRGILAKKYDSYVDPYSKEFTVNRDLELITTALSIAMNDLDEYVIVWGCYDGNINQKVVYAKKFPDNGYPVFDVTVQDFPGYPSSAMDGEGNFVVTYENKVDSEYGIYAKKYDRECNLMKSFKVSSDSPYNRRSPSVAMSKNGNFVVTWENYDYEDDILFRKVSAKLYDQNADPVDEEFLVNTDQSSQSKARPAMSDNGDFVIIWLGYSEEDDTSGIYAQLYDAEGNMKGIEFLACKYIGFPMNDPAIAMDSIGDFVVAWTSGWDKSDPNSSQDGSYSGIFAKRFDYDGNAIGDEFQVNTNTYLQQLDPSVAMDSDGDFVITWSSLHFGYTQYGTAYLQVCAQHYQVNPITREPTIDIRSNGTVFIPDYNLRIFVTVDCRYAGAVDMYACTQLSGNFYWYPTWDILPVPTELEDEKFDETIVEIKLTEDRPVGTYTFYAAITEHGNPENVLGFDHVTVSIE